MSGPSKSRPARANTGRGVGDVVSRLGPRRWRGIAAHGRFREPRFGKNRSARLGPFPRDGIRLPRGWNGRRSSCVRGGAAPERPTSGGAGRRARRRAPKPRSPLMPWPAPAASSGVLRGLFRARGVECCQRNLAKRELPCQGSLRRAWIVPGFTPPQEWVRERLVPQANWARGRPLPRLHSGASSRIRAGWSPCRRCGVRPTEGLVRHRVFSFCPTAPRVVLVPRSSNVNAFLKANGLPCAQVCQPGRSWTRGRLREV